MAVVVAEGLVPASETEERLSPLDCRIEAGTVVCLVGPSRQRPTRYLRTLAAVDRPRAGRLYLLEEAAATLTATAWRQLRRRVAYVSCRAPLLSVLSGFDNVTLPALYHRIDSEKAIRARAQRLLDALPYAADHAVLPAYMPALQQRHLLLARALILEPEALFFDDPFQGLDSAERDLLADYLAGPARAPATALVVATGDLAFVRQHADQILFLGPSSALRFSSWRALRESGADEVRAFLEREEQVCEVFR